MLDNAFITGRIKSPVIKMLDLMYNIKPETYVLAEEDTSVKNNTSQAINPDDNKHDAYWKRLYDVTYEAIYNAFKKAINE